MPGKKSGITDLEGGREKRVKKKKKRSMPGYRRRWRVGYKEESDASKGMRESASNHEFNAFYDVHEPSFTVRVDRFPQSERWFQARLGIMAVLIAFSYVASFLKRVSTIVPVYTISRQTTETLLLIGMRKRET